MKQTIITDFDHTTDYESSIQENIDSESPIYKVEKSYDLEIVGNSNKTFRQEKL